MPPFSLLRRSWRPSSSSPRQQQQQQQQQHQQQQKQHAVSGGTNPAARLALTPEIERAITQFKTNMLNNLSKHTPYAAQIIDTAIHKVKGLPAQASVPNFESVEKALIDGLQTMIKSMQGGRQNLTSASPAPTAHAAGTKSTPTRSSTPSVAADEEIQRRIKSFRDNIIERLKKKTDQAEAIVDSAINRAKGLPNPGSFRGWEEADRLMYESVSKIISDVRKTHGLGPQPTSSIPIVSQSQLGPSIQTAPSSASPASGQPSAFSTATQQSNGITTPLPATSPPPPGAFMPASKSMSPSITRPSPSISRPATMGIARPGIGSIARPPVARPESVTSSQAPARSTPAPTPNVSTPAPPSAGVVSQIANSQQRTSDDMARKVSSPAPPSAGVLDQITGQKRAADTQHTETKERPVIPAVSAAPVLIHAPSPTSHMFSPTPPSAGVLAQIAGQQRSTENAIKAASFSSTTISTPAPFTVGTTAPSHQPANAPSIHGITPPLPSPSQSASTGRPAAAGHHQSQQIPGATIVSTPTRAVALSSNVSTGMSGQSINPPPQQPANSSTNVTMFALPRAPVTSLSSSSPMSGTAATSEQATGESRLSDSLTKAQAQVQAPALVVSSLPSPSTSTSTSAVANQAATQKQQHPLPPPLPPTVQARQAPPPPPPAMPAMPAPLPKRPTPPQLKPSAGVVEQIVGQKRTLDEGPGASDSDGQDAPQPEPKKLAVSPT